MAANAASQDSGGPPPPTTDSNPPIPTTPTAGLENQLSSMSIHAPTFTPTTTESSTAPAAASAAKLNASAAPFVVSPAFSNRSLPSSPGSARGRGGSNRGGSPRMMGGYVPPELVKKPKLSAEEMDAKMAKMKLLNEQATKEAEPSPPPSAPSPLAPTSNSALNAFIIKYKSFTSAPKPPLTRGLSDWPTAPLTSKISLSAAPFVPKPTTNMASIPVFVPRSVSLAVDTIPPPPNRTLTPISAKINAITSHPELFASKPKSGSDAPPSDSGYPPIVLDANNQPHFLIPCPFPIDPNASYPSLYRNGAFLPFPQLLPTQPYRPYQSLGLPHPSGGDETPWNPAKTIPDQYPMPMSLRKTKSDVVMSRPISKPVIIKPPPLIIETPECPSNGLGFDPFPIGSSMLKPTIPSAASSSSIDIRITPESFTHVSQSRLLGLDEKAREKDKEDYIASQAADRAREAEAKKAWDDKMKREAENIKAVEAEREKARKLKMARMGAKGNAEEWTTPPKKDVLFEKESVPSFNPGSGGFFQEIDAANVLQLTNKNLASHQDWSQNTTETISAFVENVGVWNLAEMASVREDRAIGDEVNDAESEKVVDPCFRTAGVVEAEAKKNVDPCFRTAGVSSMDWGSGPSTSFNAPPRGRAGDSWGEPTSANGPNQSSKPASKPASVVEAWDDWTKQPAPPPEPAPSNISGNLPVPVTQTLKAHGYVEAQANARNFDSAVKSNDFYVAPVHVGEQNSPPTMVNHFRVESLDGCPGDDDPTAKVPRSRNEQTPWLGKGYSTVGAPLTGTASQAPLPKPSANDDWGAPPSASKPNTQSWESSSATPSSSQSQPSRPAPAIHPSRIAIVDHKPNGGSQANIAQASQAPPINSWGNGGINGGYGSGSGGGGYDRSAATSGTNNLPLQNSRWGGGAGGNQGNPPSSESRGGGVGTRWGASDNPSSGGDGGGASWGTSSNRGPSGDGGGWNNSHQAPRPPGSGGYGTGLGPAAPPAMPQRPPINYSIGVRPSREVSEVFKAVPGASGASSWAPKSDSYSSSQSGGYAQSHSSSTSASTGAWMTSSTANTPAKTTTQLSSGDDWGSSSNSNRGNDDAARPSTPKAAAAKPAEGEWGHNKSSAAPASTTTKPVDDDWGYGKGETPKAARIELQKVVDTAASQDDWSQAPQSTTSTVDSWNNGPVAPPTTKAVPSGSERSGWDQPAVSAPAKPASQDDWGSAPAMSGGRDLPPHMRNIAPAAAVGVPSRPNPIHPSRLAIVDHQQKPTASTPATVSMSEDDWGKSPSGVKQDSGRSSAGGDQGWGARGGDNFQPPMRSRMGGPTSYPNAPSNGAPISYPSGPPAYKKPAGNIWDLPPKPLDEIEKPEKSPPIQKTVKANPTPEPAAPVTSGWGDDPDAPPTRAAPTLQVDKKEPTPPQSLISLSSRPSSVANGSPKMGFDAGVSQSDSLIDIKDMKAPGTKPSSGIETLDASMFGPSIALSEISSLF